jgi:hypothetical protein
MAMTAREQLAEQVSRPRPVLERTCTSLIRPEARKILTLLLEREITLTARMLDPSPLTKLIQVGGVNAAEVCGIPAHHLLITKFWIYPPDIAHLTATSDHAVDIELLDSPSPWRGSPEVDFDALLDVLDGGSVPSETWHDRPGLL